MNEAQGPDMHGSYAAHQHALATALEPCPFCGGKAAFVPRAANLALQKDPSNPKFGVSVICGGCGSESANWIDEAHAARAWNRRAVLCAAGVPAQPLTPHQQYWVDRRSEIIAALEAEGLQIMSNKDRVWLRRAAGVPAGAAQSDTTKEERHGDD